MASAAIMTTSCSESKRAFLQEARDLAAQAEKNVNDWEEEDWIDYMTKASLLTYDFFNSTPSDSLYHVFKTIVPNTKNAKPYVKNIFSTASVKFAQQRPALIDSVSRAEQLLLHYYELAPKEQPQGNN